MLNFICDAKYLVFPINRNATSKSLMFMCEDKLVFDLDINLDYTKPEFYTYVDISRFSGKTLSLSVEPEMELKIQKSNIRYENETMYMSDYRPEYHFTAIFGWLNDPNGLFYYNDKYHMFFQYNPVGCQWGNMHWGHAVSSDLIHWEEKDCAIYPNELGTAFSGSAFVDYKNVSGFKENENPPILLFYTAAGGSSKLSVNKKFTQCVVYSVDGGETYKEYKNNPIIENIVEGNRDPKVEYDPKSGKYVLTLFLDKNDFAIFTSSNLLDWTKTQTITLPNDAECPDFYPLYFNGVTKWVLTAANDHYYIGDFDGKKFIPQGEEGRLHYGNAAYAAQTWNGDKNSRRLRVSWNTFELQNLPFNKQMTFPCEMSLKADDIGNPALCINPVDEIKEFYGDIKLDSGIHIVQNSYSMELGGECYDINLEIEQKGKPITVSLFGASIVVEDNTVACFDKRAPLVHSKMKAKIRILVDKTSLEIYIGDGQSFMSLGHMMDYNLNRLNISSEDAEIINISIAEIKA